MLLITPGWGIPGPLAKLITLLLLLLLTSTVMLHRLNDTTSAEPAQTGSRAPSNDHFSQAAVLTLPSGEVVSAMVNDIELATIEPGEPKHGCRRGAAGTGSYSVWYRFTISQPGNLRLSTEQSDLRPAHDTIISIYQGASLPTLTETACNDDAGGIEYSVLHTYLAPGSYFVKVSYWPNTPTEPMETVSVLRLNARYDANAIPLTPSHTPIPTVGTPSTPIPTSGPSNPTVAVTISSVPMTSTPTATTIGAGENLILNGDFEFDADADKLPDGWEGKQLQKDKRVCNTNKKIIAYRGMCAFRFKNKGGEASKLMQSVSVDQLAKGDTLIFSGAFEVTQPVGKTVVLKVIYAEPDAGLKRKGKDKLKVRLDAITYGYSRLSQSFTLLGTPTKMTVKLVHKQRGTRLMIDDLSLMRQKP